MIYALTVSVVVVAVYVWGDGLHSCNDGVRYCSGKRQPYPFHRRFCHWPEDLLIVVSLASLIALGTLMGTWSRALMLMTLPGAWFCATRPTTVDAPCMLLAFVASTLLPTNPWLAVALSLVSGAIHERGPVFAALYAWNPMLLLGLFGVMWWRKAAPPDGDNLVGHGFVKSLLLHRPHNDWMKPAATLHALRGVPFFAAAYGTSLSAWVTLGIAWASRIVGTDLARHAFWAGPALIRDMPEVPAWLVMAHAATFRRMN